MPDKPGVGGVSGVGGGGGRREWEEMFWFEVCFGRGCLDTFDTSLLVAQLHLRTRPSASGRGLQILLQKKCALHSILKLLLIKAVTRLNVP